MPRKTEWIHRIPAALQVLRQSSAPLIDRQDLAELLGISDRHAVRILHRLGASEAGKNLFLSRQELIVRLQAIQAGEEAHYERRRLARLGTALAGAATGVKARRVPIAAGAASQELLFPALPSAVRLQPGQLRIEFRGPEELLRRLYELSQAIANDYEAFERLLTEPPGAGSGPPLSN